ncbi:hypothetical protein F5148DRAFT_537906 [Russula earlei]|uniref:Uncharacterized protein n=1 Tax=Russula earlei TaxID=71964 RepID=A0ACC0UIP2_9AGAM|nr:hypothetical protein F5148DRAFT_537906 [Russula earlei]
MLSNGIDSRHQWENEVMGSDLQSWIRPRMGGAPTPRYENLVLGRGDWSWVAGAAHPTFVEFGGMRVLVPGVTNTTGGNDLGGKEGLIPMSVSDVSCHLHLRRLHQYLSINTDKPWAVSQMHHCMVQMHYLGHYVPAGALQQAAFGDAITLANMLYLFFSTRGSTCTPLRVTSISVWSERKGPLKACANISRHYRAHLDGPRWSVCPT